MHEELLEKIRNNTSQICVIGLGQVGLPVALSFCKAGFIVKGLDINENQIKSLRNQQSPFKEPILQELLSKYIQEEKFFPTQEQNVISDSDIIVICVPTPITDEIKPDLMFLKNVCKTISKFEINGKLIVVESSIPPKTFDSMVLPILSENNNNFYACYIPERLSPGQAFEEISTTSRVIGSKDQKSGNIARVLYKKIVKADVFETNPLVAETCKLVENTFRDVNIALANEIAMICEEYGIDVLEVQRICNSHPRVNLLTPGPGVGGPCLPKDPFLLLNPQNSKQIHSEVILHARKVNDQMPNHVFELIKNALKNQNKDIKDSTIAVLGTAYKGNISDTRHSPSESIVNFLLSSCKNVRINDPHSQIDYGAKYEKNISEAIKKSDVVVVLTDHDEYKKIMLEDIKKDMNLNPIIIDTKRIFDRTTAEEMGFYYIGIGYSKNQTVKST